MNELPIGEISTFEIREHIDGQWSTPSVATGTWLTDPNDGSRAMPMRASAPESLERAIATAAKVQRAGVWADLTPEQRGQCLRAIAVQIEPRCERMARLDAQASGVVVNLTRKFAAVASRAFVAAADQAEQRSAPIRRPIGRGFVEIHRLPLGPALVIAPWNAPAAIAAHKVASALAAGCSVVLKPSEYAPQSCQLLVEAAEAAGLPQGVLQLVHGDGAVGDALAKDARIAAVSFTGGLGGGRAVAHRSAEFIRPAQLELGGNNPLIALPSADIDATARAIAAGLTLLGGQWCRALGRILVHRSLAESLLNATLAALEKVRIGHSLDDKSEMGPMAHEPQLSSVRRAIHRLTAAGGKAHTRTKLPLLGGFFTAPTIVTNIAPRDATEEIFGPVATWHPFDHVEEALDLARLGDYGLAAYVFGRESDALGIARRVHAGSVKINEVSILALDPTAPRPAWGLSGLGDEGATETFEFFRGSRVVACSESRELSGDK
jgi:phenylacetaldehyde dehydrogenase